FVLRVERTHDEVRCIIGSEIIAAEVLGPIMPVEDTGPGLCLSDVGLVSRDIRELQLGADHIGVVGRGAGRARGTCAIGVEQAASYFHPYTDESGGALRRLEPHRTPG